MKKTHCFELWMLMTGGKFKGDLVQIQDEIKKIESNYTANGYGGIVQDVYDNQKHKITIEPVEGD